MNDRQIYVRTVLNLYTQLPDVACTPRRSDRVLASVFFDRRIPLEVVAAALLLGSARRLSHGPIPALGAIRSLHYFESIVKELAAHPPPPEYLDYLRSKVQSKTVGQAAISPDLRTP